MRGRRRSPKGLPPPPGGNFRRDDRRHAGPRDRRRRSPTPERFRRGNSPPPFKRGRYGGREPDDFFPPPRGGGGGGYEPGYYGGRPSPPPRREGPRPYKDFCRTLPDDVTPEEAQKEFQQYLAEYFGSEVRADFESKKNEDWMKSRFDPRGMRKAMQERNAEAQAAAADFSQQLREGALDPTSPKFNQGLDGKEGDGDKAGEDDEDMESEGEEAAKDPKVETAPSLCWLPARLAADSHLSKRLITLLDREKAIKPSPFAEGGQEVKAGVAARKVAESGEKVVAEPAEKTGAAGEEAAAVGVEKVEEGENGNAEGEKAGVIAEGKEEVAGEAEKANGDVMETDKSVQEEKPAESKEEPPNSEAAAKSEDPGAAIEKLDLQLTYLWKVHGVDYYAGKELSEPMQYKLRLTTPRMMRGPRPEEGEQPTEAEDKQSKKIVEKRIDQTWKKRLTAAADPFEVSLQKEKIEQLVEDWVEDQVKQIDDNKWGCKLSQKLFVGKDYVLKHIKLKHTEKMEAQRSKICDDIFWENYKRFREQEQQMMQAQVAKMQQAMQMQQGVGAAGLPMPWDGGSAGAGHSGTMAGPGGLAGFGGGGFPGVMPGMGAMPPPIIPRGVANPLLAGAMMPGPGQVLVLAPGAGPMGPFISVPIAEAGGYGRGPLGPPRGGGHMGRGPVRGGRFPPPFAGGRGPRPPPSGGPNYYDLDNPSNNRSVLDYGDL